MSSDSEKSKWTASVYDHDIVNDARKVKKRKKGVSKRFRNQNAAANGPTALCVGLCPVD